jgi:hypothetical protein
MLIDTKTGKNLGVGGRFIRRGFRGVAFEYVIIDIYTDSVRVQKLLKGKLVGESIEPMKTLKLEKLK